MYESSPLVGNVREQISVSLDHQYRFIEITFPVFSGPVPIYRQIADALLAFNHQRSYSLILNRLNFSGYIPIADLDAFSETPMLKSRSGAMIVLSADTLTKDRFAAGCYAALFPSFPVYWAGSQKEVLRILKAINAEAA